MIVLPYVFFAWRGPAKELARPYILASAVYLLMLFLLLPIGHQRYFLPFVPIVGWAVPGFLGLFRRPRVRGIAFAALVALTVLPAFVLVKALGETPPAIAALQWVRSSRPAAVLYSGALRRHAQYYWPEGDSRSTPRTEAQCEKVRTELGLNRAVLSTNPELCGLAGAKIASFVRDRRVNDKLWRVSVFEFRR